MARERADAVVVQGIFFSKTIADLAIKHRLPAASVFRSFLAVGGLMSYGADIPYLFRHSALFVHRILQGAKPADLPGAARRAWRRKDPERVAEIIRASE
jgi:ABC-type uncharacterized transport system substrate-binding protein